MVLSLVTDILTGAPCTLELQLDAESNRKSSFLTKDRYVVQISASFQTIAERETRRTYIQMVKIFAEVLMLFLNLVSEWNILG
jgi:hypothetical protein